MSSITPSLIQQDSFPEDSAFAVACVMKAHLQQVAFDAEVEDRKKMTSALLTLDYVRRVRVAIEQELVKTCSRCLQC